VGSKRDRAWLRLALKRLRSTALFTTPLVRQIMMGGFRNYVSAATCRCWLWWGILQRGKGHLGLLEAIDSMEDGVVLVSIRKYCPRLAMVLANRLNKLAYPELF